MGQRRGPAVLLLALGEGMPGQGSGRGDRAVSGVSGGRGRCMRCPLLPSLSPFFRAGSAQLPPAGPAPVPPPVTVPRPGPVSGWQLGLAGLGSPRVRRDLGKPDNAGHSRGTAGAPGCPCMEGTARRAGTPRGGGALCPQRCRCSLRPPVLAGHLAGLLAAGPACADAYRGLSDCVLKLGDSMATYEEEEGIELQGLRRVCR